MTFKKVLTLWERLRRETVWHPIHTDPNDDNRSGPRFWYPTYDIIAFILGGVALMQGSPLLNRLFPWWFTNGMGFFLMLAALCCLVGVIFPRLTLAELIGKLGIVFLLGAYAGTVAFVSDGDQPNSFPVIVLVMSVWLLGPRITKLFTQLYRMRREQRKGRA